MKDWLLGHIGSQIIYPAAEKYLGRDIRTRVARIRENYERPFSERRKLQLASLVEVLEWAQQEVPFYHDLFKTLNFSPPKILQDERYFSDLPVLTKKDILEQGERLLAKSLVGQWATKNKTGGSTGGSVFIWYDQAAADESAAITRFARTLCKVKTFSLAARTAEKT